MNTAGDIPITNRVVKGSQRLRGSMYWIVALVGVVLVPGALAASTVSWDGPDLPGYARMMLGLAVGATVAACTLIFLAVAAWSDPQRLRRAVVLTALGVVGLAYVVSVISISYTRFLEQLP